MTPHWPGIKKRCIKITKQLPHELHKTVSQDPPGQLSLDPLAGLMGGRFAVLRWSQMNTLWKSPAMGLLSVCIENSTHPDYKTAVLRMFDDTSQAVAAKSW